MSRFLRRSLLILALGLVLVGILTVVLCVDNARQRAKTAALVELYNTIEVGMIRTSVAALRTNNFQQSLKWVDGVDWEKCFCGVLDDSLLYVRYTSNVVDFVGIVSNDVITNKPKNAPPWKRRIGTELPY